MAKLVRKTRAEQDFDPITFSVILNRFVSIAEAMTLTMEKTAYTPILALCRDFSCAIYDTVPRQLCMSDAIPIHTNSMHLSLSEIAKSIRGEIKDGDVYVCNHPFRANTHVGDLVTAAPVFTAGRQLFWSVTKGHQQDCGAFLPSSVVVAARDVWQEGLLIPPLKLVDEGRERSDIIDLYLSNVRYPELLHGDLRAQLASIEKGKVELLELVDEYGPEQLMRYVDEIINYADRRMSQEIGAMPDGRYEAETWIDSDGAETLDIPIKVSVTISGDQVKADYTGSGPQSPTGQNGTYACLQAAPGMPFLCYVASDIPKNHGCLQHIEAHAPEGTICNARHPASTSTATITPSNQMHDVIHKAMAPAIPDRAVAAGARTNNMPNFAGVDELTGKAWGVMVFNNMGGQGGAKEADGWPMWGTSTGMGATKISSVEQLELMYPLFIEEMEVERDSMGAGEWIGGPGNRFRVRPTRGPIACSTFGDGYRNPPHGILGGTRGIGGGQYVEKLKTGERRFISSTGHFTFHEDEVFVGVATGGGGYGAPANRDVEQVRRDVRDGLITRETARELFGVEVSDEFDPVIDRAATDALRERLEGIEPAISDPDVAGASTWLATNMRDGDEYLLNPVEL